MQVGTKHWAALVPVEVRVSDVETPLQLHVQEPSPCVPFVQLRVRCWVKVSPLHTPLGDGVHPDHGEIVRGVQGTPHRLAFVPVDVLSGSVVGFEQLWVKASPRHTVDGEGVHPPVQVAQFSVPGLVLRLVYVVPLQSDTAISTASLPMHVLAGSKPCSHVVLVRVHG